MKVYIKSATNVADIEAKIAKKQAEIDKKEAWIKKKEAAIEKKMQIITPAVTSEELAQINKVLDYLSQADSNTYRRPEGYSLTPIFRKYDWEWGNPVREALSSAEDDAESIGNSALAIKEATAIRDKYKAQIEAIKAKDKKVDEIPEVMKEFMNQLIDEWDRYDLDIKERSPQFYRDCKAKMNELAPNTGYSRDRFAKILELYPEDAITYENANPRNKYWVQRDIEDKFENQYLHIPFRKEFGVSLDYAQNLWKLTPEQIHANNVKEGKRVILDLTDRVTKITGPITSYAGLHLTQGNGGWAVLNGFVEGEDGKAEVNSILASGPIQRLHIRTLVKEVH